MICKQCNIPMKVQNTREVQSDDYIRLRYYVCLLCGKRVNTMEKVIEKPEDDNYVE